MSLQHIQWSTSRYDRPPSTLGSNKYFELLATPNGVHADHWINFYTEFGTEGQRRHQQSTSQVIPRSLPVPKATFYPLNIFFAHLCALCLFVCLHPCDVVILFLCERGWLHCRFARTIVTNYSSAHSAKNIRRDLRSEAAKVERRPRDCHLTPFCNAPLARGGILHGPSSPSHREDRVTGQHQEPPPLPEKTSNTR